MNMDYCKFENTFFALKECEDHLDSEAVEDIIAEANDYEKPYVSKLIKLCKKIAEDYSEELEEYEADQKQES